MDHMTENYIVTHHAVKRAAERLGVDQDHAADYLQWLMNYSISQGIVGAARAFLHQPSGIRIMLDLTDDVIITVYGAKDDRKEQGKAIRNDRLRAALERELKSIIEDTMHDVNYLSKQYDRLVMQCFTLELESHCCKSDAAFEAIQGMIERNMISMENIEREIEHSMKETEQANKEICAVCL